MKISVGLLESTEYSLRFKNIRFESKNPCSHTPSIYHSKWLWEACRYLGAYGQKGRVVLALKSICLAVFPSLFLSLWICHWLPVSLHGKPFVLAPHYKLLLVWGGGGVNIYLSKRVWRQGCGQPPMATRLRRIQGSLHQECLMKLWSVQTPPAQGMSC